MPYLSCPKQLYRLFPCNSIKRDIGQHSQYLQFFRLEIFTFTLVSWVMGAAMTHWAGGVSLSATKKDSAGCTRHWAVLLSDENQASSGSQERLIESVPSIALPGRLDAAGGAGHIRAAAPLAASWAQPQCRTPVQKCSAAASAVQMRWITNDVGRLLLFVRNVNDCTHNLSHICKASFG